MKIYTGFGDKGQTKLHGGKVVNKDHLRVDVYGILDELNSWLGLIINQEIDELNKKELEKIQNDLFIISAEIATPGTKNRDHLLKNLKDLNYIKIEDYIDNIEKKLTPLKNFILPGGTKLSSYYHIARTVCRRAERQLTKLNQVETLQEPILIYLNRLSDLLFVLARMANKNEKKEDIIWSEK